MSEPTPSPYGELLADVKQRIRAAQYEALRAVNQQLIGLYWDIRETGGSFAFLGSQYRLNVGAPRQPPATATAVPFSYFYL